MAFIYKFFKAENIAKSFPDPRAFVANLFIAIAPFSPKVFGNS